MECRHQPGISIALRKRKGLQTEPKIIALSSNPDMFCEMQKAIPNLAFQAGPLCPFPGRDVAVMNRFVVCYYKVLSMNNIWLLLLAVNFKN